MKIASSPMSAIEALQLDAAYVAVAKSLGLPCQSYMALSDGPILDAQAGAETFGSALIAALAGVNSVSGPGMLDFLLVFSLPKLVFDDEMCGQALRFVREVQPARRPAGRRAHRPADGRPAPDHGRRTRWPTGRPSCTCRAPIVDRDNREAWTKQGAKDTYQRAVRRGRPAARGVPAARDRSGDRRRVALHHPRPASSSRTGSRTSRSPPSRSSPPVPGPASAATTAVANSASVHPARRIPPRDQSRRRARHDRFLDALLRAVVPALAVLREDPRGRLQRLRHLQPHVPAGLLRRPDRGVLGAAQRRDRVGRRRSSGSSRSPGRTPPRSPTC